MSLDIAGASHNVSFQIVVNIHVIGYLSEVKLLIKCKPVFILRLHNKT